MSSSCMLKLRCSNIRILLHNSKTGTHHDVGDGGDLVVGRDHVAGGQEEVAGGHGGVQGGLFEIQKERA